MLGTRTREAASASLARAFTPLVAGHCPQALAIMGAWYVLAMGVWVVFQPPILPSPVDVLRSLPALWVQDGLGQELVASLLVSVEALALSALIALPLAYVSRVPALRPLARGVAQLRFLSPAVFYLPLLFLLSSGHLVKIWMLTIGETFFLVTSMVDVVDAIPLERFDDCRTLRMSPWKSTWYVVVRGTVAEAFTAIRANNAMGWSALMMVEGIVRSEGGAGVLILNHEKHMNLDSVWAIAAAILVVGLAMDALLGLARAAVCPYAEAA